ncbi:MAG: hypothetical protein K6D59_11365 [Bacteroidales bacterium]|nr:hypothetical protein [Bacteroidales bacterium]
MKKVIYSLALSLTLIGCGHAFAQDDNSHTNSKTVVGLQNGRVTTSQNDKFNMRQNINRTVTHLQAKGKSHVTLVYDTVNYINVNCDSKEWNFRNDFIFVKGTTLLIDDPDGVAVYEIHLKRNDLQFVNRTQQAEIIYGKSDDEDYRFHTDTIIINSFTNTPLESTDNMALHQSIEDARRQLNEAKVQLRKSRDEYKEHIKDLKRKQAEIIEFVSEDFTMPDSTDTAFWNSWNNQYTFDNSESDTENFEDELEDFDDEWGYGFEDRFSPSFLWAFNNWGDQWYNGLSKLDGAYNLKTSFTSWQLEMQYKVIMTRHFNLSLGVGYESDIYKFSDPLVDIDANGNIHNTIDALPNQNYNDFIAANQCFDGTSLNDWSSSMLTRYISIPVTFGFRVDEFELGFTALPALALNTQHTGLKHKLDTRSIDYQDITSIGNQLAPYKIDLRVDMRFYHIGLFLQVATSPLFQSSNQALYPIEFGFIIK